MSFTTTCELTICFRTHRLHSSGGLNEISRYGYQVAGNGRWISLALKRPKKKNTGGARKAKKPIQQVEAADTMMDEDNRLEEEEDGADADSNMVVNNARSNGLVSHLNVSLQEILASPTVPKKTTMTTQVAGTDLDPDDPNLTLPLVRYNAMLAVLRNTLYMWVLFLMHSGQFHRLTKV